MEKIDWGRLVNKAMWWQWVVVTTGLVAGIGLWFMSLKHLPPQVPLFYSRPWGEEQLADPRFLWLPIGIMVIIAMVTTLSVTKLKLDRVLAAMLLGAGLTTEIILLLAVIRIVILVI